MDKLEKAGWKTIKIKGLHQESVPEAITTEFPLTLMLDGHEFATIVCSPSELEDLTIGFLASEGIIRKADEIKELQVDMYTGFAHISLHQPVQPQQFDHSSRFIGSCCGKSRQFYFKSDVRVAKTVTSKLEIKVSECIMLMEDLLDSSLEFQKTGGVHSAALATSDGLLYTRSDIGRHNALDKVFGSMLRGRISAKEKLVVFSGRISSEVLLKISKMGIGLILSKSAVTDLAVQLANDLGITVIGFTRGDRMNIYTHSHRVVDLHPDLQTD
ncbi:formate dehydrogenase accessory sulfurtransferase FdhD [Oceanobacillus luteolus]|uniref:formate dehydrogenase accessory sulfurtransferase FdhD n=1 Tax=Oceanobacillus luteolus TaxID=1274358 RepID=UPI00203EF973|nr:formate dehydrogenase accessory sulfurtransferase FdhD [Oceanobacillus luteolus]MCM3739159.1 formate dehydrogenase accessory sulfurtransferase FdhD [Oceanobacillus luteolus]